ncbi:DUF2663 family protein [Paucisalibacillus sp. EB02]|uniref:DUF2663 family protein n=1 Tax=Paucisalibacillus sp. EB02 TaxID=1347087 RepID=UPI0004B0BB29|nr:DUF2663 family protein [Paucisalibacillus sp. EB02]
MPLKTVENLSSETIHQLKEVIKKSNKKKRFERLRNNFLIAALLLLLVLFSILYVVDLRYVSDPFTTFANIILNPYYLFNIGLISLAFVYYNFFQKKLKKEKDKLNNVRKEVIDHLNDSKNMNLQDKVDAIKKEMKDVYDINLYVKNK